MATVRIYLDTRRAKKNSEYPIKIVVNHRKDIMLSTDHSALKSHFKGGRYKNSITNSRVKNAELSQRVSEIERALLTLEVQGRLKYLTDKQLKSILEGGDKTGFFDTFEEFIKTRKSERTKELYQRTLDIVKNYDPSADFTTIDPHWLSNFETELLKEMRINTVAIELRNIRAVFNFALSNDPSIPYPFRKFKVKSERTPHRNVTANEIKRIVNYKGKFSHFSDFFMLSFYLIGMNMKDILSLKNEDYTNGRIKYRRLKTGALYDIKVEPEAKELIEKYKGDIFLLSFSSLYKDYSGFKRGVNYALKKLEDENGVINEKLSTYYARHTWASIAAELDIPDAVISQALGHSTANPTTAIYINRNQKKVDEANRKVIDYINSSG